MKKKTASKRQAAEKIVAEVQEAIGVSAARKDYEDGFAAGRLAMQSETDEHLIAGLVALTKDSKSKSPVLVSHATVEAVARFWRKHKEPVVMHSQWRVLTQSETAADNRTGLTTNTWPTGTGNTPQDVQLASLVTRPNSEGGAS